MGPEKEIVIWWLNKSGFFTISNIKVSHNKEVDILAYKPSSGELLHIELSCSVSTGILALQRSPEAAVKEYINKRFNDSDVEKAVNKRIKEFFGKSQNDALSGKYEKAVVLGVSTKHKTEELIRLFRNSSIKVLRFDELLLDVMNALDGQNYKSDVIRTLQLSKFLLLSSPKHAADLLSNSGSHEVLNSVSREEFLQHLFERDEFTKILQKGANEAILLNILKKSSLKKTERFVKLLDEHFTSRSRKKIHRELSRIENIEQVSKKKDAPKKEKSLLSFFSAKK